MTKYSTPKRKVRQGDKFERSPNSLARCRKCMTKIHKGDVRVGVEEWNQTYEMYRHRYYHDQCCPMGIKSRLKLPYGGTPEQELKRQFKQSQRQAALIEKRRELREKLRTLRKLFANRLGNKPAFLVFHDSTLDEIVIKLPTTKKELLEIKGIGPKKIQSFGRPILKVIEQWLKSPTHSLECTEEKFSTQASDIADIQPEKTLSCEEIVSQKFQDASANGYLISI